jgi:hypothetical protein
VEKDIHIGGRGLKNNRRREPRELLLCSLIHNSDDQWKNYLALNDLDSVRCIECL